MSRVFYPRAVCQLDLLLNNYGQPNYNKEFHTLIIPTNVHINRNAYNEADTFSMTIRQEDFSVYPEIIKSVRVRIAIIDNRNLDSLKDKPLSVEDIVFTGFADTSQVMFDESERVVTLNGRDYTSVFIDTVFDNASLEDAAGKRTRVIDLNRPVVDIIKDLISNVPAAGDGIRIRNEIGEAALKKFAQAVPNYRLTTGKETTDGLYTSVNPNKTYWDTIVSLCEAAGIIVYMDLDELVLTSPRILYSSPTINSKQTLQFLYGKNLSSLEFSKNLGRRKKFNVKVRSFNVRKGIETVVVIPRDGRKSWAKDVGVDTSLQKISELDTNGVKRERTAPVFTFTEERNKTRDQLIDRGQQIFEEFVRQELSGSCETYDMRVDDDNGVEFDLVKIKTGTPIRIEILLEDVQNLMRFTTSGDRVSEGKRVEEFNKKVGYLIRRGYPAGVASDFVKAMSFATSKVRPLFYTRAAEISMSASGFSLRIDFVNYIAVFKELN